jgi:geranylgeranyl pyrophosphate synthase
MNRSAVQPPVTRAMEAAGQWIAARMTAVETRLAELVGDHGEALREDASATLTAGGKRLRPLLVLLCAGSDGGERAVRGATAVELVHMATLVHDDVLDAAPLRRGQPTVVARSGRLRATATGDLLLSRAFAELAADRRQVELLSGASVSLALGELAQRRDAWDISTSAERYLERCRLKTAALFECACLIGRSPGGPALEERLRAFGRGIGLAFQLLDDVLDVTGPPERTGKARGTDLLDGTVTLPLILARERDPSLAETDLRALDADAAEKLCDRIAATGATEIVRERGRERVEAAKAELAVAPLADGDRRLLELVADGVVERYA